MKKVKGRKRERAVLLEQRRSSLLQKGGNVEKKETALMAAEGEITTDVVTELKMRERESSCGTIGRNHYCGSDEIKDRREEEHSCRSGGRYN